MLMSAAPYVSNRVIARDRYLLGRRATWEFRRDVSRFLSRALMRAYIIAILPAVLPVQRFMYRMGLVGSWTMGVSGGATILDTKIQHISWHQTGAYKARQGF